MLTIPYIQKKIGSRHFVWFQNSNRYIQLEEPAWFVFRKVAKRCKPATIIADFITRYGLSAEESAVFVGDIRSEIENLNQPDNTQIRMEKVPDELNKINFTPYSVHRYRLGNKLIEFCYETPVFEHYLHPLIGHLETAETGDAMPLFELFGARERIVFRYNGEAKGIWSNGETHLVKGLIFMFLINVMHDKTDTDWLMTVHASAITNGLKTILFSAPPGHGKTTMAALLQSRGYQLISDDFVPIERNSFKAYPFPIAMSVKQGSMEVLGTLFPALEQKGLNYISPEKIVRYFTPESHSDVSSAAFPVREFVFIEYNSSVDFEWKKLDPGNAIKQLLDQAWIVPDQGNAAFLFEWITQVSFFQLTYSDNEMALDTIINLIDHEQ